MIVSVEIENQVYRIDTKNPLDVSIPLDFGGAQPNAYGVERAVSKPCETGNLIGDTRRGGSCNFEQVQFIPHCNGTHTECVGHITHRRISVRDCLQDAFIFAALVSVAPEQANETGETYSVDLSDEDQLITRNKLESALDKIDDGSADALIVRTLPNDAGKQTRTYLEIVPPFFSTEAMRFIRERGVRHLLVDTPSIDRIYDEGKLINHRLFWGIAPGAFETNETSRAQHSITELIYAPDNIEDGNYLLNLQIPSFAADAAPSRPLLFRISPA